MEIRIFVVLALNFIFLPLMSLTRGQTGAQSVPLQTELQLFSPRLTRLAQELQKGDSNTTLDSFWKEISQQGTPLVEPITDSEQYVFVTFLWKGDAETKNVVVLTLGNDQLGNADYFAKAQLFNLPDSNLWFRTYRLRDDARFSYRIAANDSLEVLKSFNPDPKRLAAFKPDPFNSRHYTNVYGENSVVELKQAPPQPWSEPLPGIIEGKLEKLPFKSKILNNEREIWIYTPPAYGNTKNTFNLLIRLGTETADIPIPTILNNLIGKNKIEPTVCVLIGNADGARTREYWHNDQFAEFIAKELVPWIRQNYRVTNNAKKTIIAGSSLGGGTAIFLAMEHPELFGNVISQSGGYMYPHRPEDFQKTRFPEELLQVDFPENEWLTRQLVSRPKLPLRFYLEVGLMEDVIWQTQPPRYAYPSLLLAARHLRDVLQAKGYEVFYHEYNGAHEPMGRRGTFADALLRLAGTARADTAKR
jgi:enterochelin esterase-like enzyme